MGKKRIIAAFKKDFPSLEEAKKDLLVLRGEVARGKKGELRPWYNQALREFKEPGPRGQSWHGVILPKLMFEAQGKYHF